ncbi:hypothetical protein GGF32_001001 [Allomyces javanicus]|nr:hypothetical protein GGF32_001001 [Allomyces javanicus]
MAIAAAAGATAASRFGNLTLNHFIIRRQALALYRGFLRDLKGAPNKRDLQQWVRSEFERTRFETDLARIQNYIAAGKAERKRLANMVSLGHA